MRVLVTGGGGYLGSCLVALLLDKGHAVRVLDRFCFGMEALADVKHRDQCEIIRGDIRRLQEVSDLLTNIDAVVHLASLSNDPTCDLDIDMAHDINVESTIELAKQAAQRGIKRFVYGSACSVYGKGVFELLDEASPTHPVSTFGQTKRDAEVALLRMKNHHFEPVIGRTATMYGVSRRMRFDLAVNQMVATALRQGRILVRGGGNQWRPFVHVHDAARALLMLLEAQGEIVSGEVFNIGSDQGNCKIKDLAELVASYIPDTRIEIARDDDDLRDFHVRFSKIEQQLGYQCEKDIAHGIREVADWLHEHGDADPFEPTFFNVARMKQLRAMPVSEGGEPLAARFIPLSKPSLGEEEETAILDALRSGWLTSGPQVPAFEKAFAETVSAPESLAVVSCTAALHLSLVDAGTAPGDEVITSPITWASTGNTLLNMGAKVVFTDVDPDTFNMDPATLESRITERTRAIMPVHMAGQPCKLDDIQAIARKYNIPVIEDAAHALGASYKGVPIGACSDYTCFSFYAIKNITTMEGGMVTLKHPERINQLRMLATNGMAATAWERYGRSAVPTPLEVVAPGFKYMMGNVSAAMGLQQLMKFKEFKAARKRLAEMYLAVLGDVDEIELPVVMPEVEHAWHLFVIRLRTEMLRKSRDEIAYDLRQENIGTGVHFYALHMHQYYREKLGMRPEDFPIATELSGKILSLPLHPQLSDKDVNEVVAALKKTLLHARK